MSIPAGGPPAFRPRLAEAALETWKVPDQGIWELRGEPRRLLHTKAMCWVALDRAIRLAPRIGLDAPSHWEAERDAIRAECMARGWNDRVGALTMEYGARPSTCRRCGCRSWAWWRPTIPG